MTQQKTHPPVTLTKKKAFSKAKRSIEKTRYGLGSFGFQLTPAFRFVANAIADAEYKSGRIGADVTKQAEQLRNFCDTLTAEENERIYKYAVTRLRSMWAYEALASVGASVLCDIKTREMIIQPCGKPSEDKEKIVLDYVISSGLCYASLRNQLRKNYLPKAFTGDEIKILRQAGRKKTKQQQASIQILMDQLTN